jgi:hypothetical protein
MYMIVQAAAAADDDSIIGCGLFLIVGTRVSQMNRKLFFLISFIE